MTRYSGIPLPYHPRNRASALVAGLERLERLQEEMVAKLITALDEAEGDTDFEPDYDDEHSLSRTEQESAYQGKRFSEGCEDGEPNLGASDHTDQRRWVADQSGQARNFDFEDQCEDEGNDSGDHEPSTDGEPDNEHESCAWADEGDQSRLRRVPVYIPPRRRVNLYANLSDNWIPVRAL